MATTLPTWPAFDIAAMAEEASQRAGIEFRSAYSLRSARLSLELLSIEWSNRGLNLWTIEGPVAIDMIPGVEQYPLPEDTIDLIEHVVRMPSTAASGYQDIPLDRFSISNYATIPNKMAPGRPTLINIRREIQPFFCVWMVPDLDTYQVVYWRLRRMLSVGSGGTGQPDIPWRFVPAMIAGLAFYMSLKSQDPNAAQRVPMLKAEYVEQFELASDEDRDRASVRLVPWGYD